MPDSGNRYYLWDVGTVGGNMLFAGFSAISVGTAARQRGEEARVADSRRFAATVADNPK